MTESVGASSTNAYRDLKPFDHFVEQAFDARHYVPVPSDWLVLVADIVASTDAVTTGRYEEVNFVGAGCVVALNSALDGVVIPTVFGGDGASAAIPGEYRDQAIDALYAMRKWARDAFGLDLRIGVVPVVELNDRGGHLSMGKLQLGPGNEVAMFRGSGLDLADDLIKYDDLGYFRLPDDPTRADALETPDLTDLSCRWSPIDPTRELMLCLIVGVNQPLTRTGDEIDAILNDVVSRIDSVVQLEDPQTSPIKVANLEFKFRFQSLVKEIKARRGFLISRALRVAGFNLLAKLMFRFNFGAGGFVPTKYIDEMVLNTDFVKVSGMVRAVVDCSAAQAAAIESLLDEEYANGRVVFGIHRARQALMTCITPDVVNGKHLHYIDATEGGFWSAASDLKSRILEREAMSDSTDASSQNSRE